jgi:tyrosine aminotransferase
MLLPSPGFCLYQVLCDYHGLETRYYNLEPEKNWEVRVEDLVALADERTCAILVNNPSNPCGAVYSRAHLEKVLGVAEELHLPIIADEVYAHMSFSEPYVSCAEAAPPGLPVLSVCALSKRWLAPGWRLGWVTVHDNSEGVFKAAGVQDSLLKLCQVSLGPSAPLQAAVPEILFETPASWYKKVLGALEMSARCCVQRCRQVPSLQVASEPQGSMYFMVRLRPGALKGIDCDDVAFAGRLLQEESIAVLPGQCFNAPGFFRVVFAAPPKVLNEAWDRIEAFCRRHSTVDV